MTSGEIVLTFSATCALCRAPIPLGTRVWWDAGTSDITCIGQHIGAAQPQETPRVSVYDQERAAPSTSWPTQSTAPTVPTARKPWDALDVNDPDWWSSFEYVPETPAAPEPPAPAAPEPPAAPAVSPEPVYRPWTPDPVEPPVPVPTPPVAPAPLPSSPPAPPATFVARDVAPAWGAPLPPTRRTGRRHSGLTTLVTPHGIAGLPAAHRRTTMRQPSRFDWDPSTSLNLGIGRSLFVLDHRSIPGFDRTVDHVIVAQTGTWVITVKHSRGLVEKRAGGTITHPRDRLLVEGHERTRALRSALVRSDAVAATIAQMGPGWDKVPVIPVLCFVDAEWRPFAQAFEVDGVVVVWPKQLGALVLGEAVIAPRSVDALAAHLDSRLRPA